ncbi:MAG: type II CRISPR-associated endonuclease Cas1 [Lactobacillus sp.]|nr:type II CRISPR-associated endonuclease Cas1 [Lactobacillus sp.]
MGWRTVIVNKHSKLSYQNNHLVYRTPSETEMIHLSEIDILILETTDILLSTMLMKRLVDENVLVIFCDDKRLPIAQVTPFYGKHDSSLQIDKQIMWEKENKQVIWTKIIAQKMINQSICLNKHEFKQSSQKLLDYCADLTIFDETNREGHAAKVYFNTLFGKGFNRDIKNQINASLDYGYTLLLSMVARAIVKNGCLTQLGLKHVNQFNQFNLASDLMEPFRPLIDDIVYQNKELEFKSLKRCLLQIFTETYHFNGKEMFLTNIIEEYTRRVIQALNKKSEEVPEFKYGV